MALDGERVGPEQSFGHPIVHQRGDGVRCVIRLAVADQSVVSGHAHEQQVGHDVRGVYGLDGNYF